MWGDRQLAWDPSEPLAETASGEWAVFPVAGGVPSPAASPLNNLQKAPMTCSVRPALK